ncbi:NAD(P)H-hydrate dehydratase [Shimia sp. R11_0]|uniref:NAD(P)H-hydrate dehydratase n=1 Tax=Shimia sp. R11_0 TaxID=2821096 RepID=UPI001ADB51E1|nr:NAD(P)H-hydrate dehydratase [Shimia sp. R11_0]MBO9479259.1 NAD(P)H-hydrate dehydratase [Shimia sp. R11_0]
MSELLTAAQMRAIEQAAIESGDVTGLELMERAGQGVVEAIFEEWPEFDCVRGDAGDKPPDSRHIAGPMKRAVVLCGPGNNGGDGFVVARLLHERGWQVEVYFYGDAEKLPPDARVNYDRWCALGGVLHPWLTKIYDDDGFLRRSLFEADVVVDALFGIGLTRGLGALHNDIWSAFDLDTGAIDRLVAVDVPSGLCADSGRVLGQQIEGHGSYGPVYALQSDLTVTFHRPKVGHFVEHGPLVCGRVVEVDIGLEQPRYAPRPDVVQQVLRGPERLLKPSLGHKFSHGHALILSGGSGKTGAARLAARGALRIGAGLVTLGVPPAAQQEVACQITTLMLQRVGDAQAFENALEDQRLNALCLGPGMGFERARELVPVALRSRRATVLDADALSAFSEDPETLFERLHEQVVLTPHGGEFARLFPDIAAQLHAPPTKGPAYSKVDATRAAAARAGCTVLFKGADTVIASADGTCAVHAAVYDRATPWLATAGSGDVLAGFITGLLARGFAPKMAAESAAWLHVECARAFGPGLIAEDLPEILPKILRKLDG